VSHSVSVPPGLLGLSKRHVLKRSYKTVAIKHIVTILGDYGRGLDSDRIY
jgi:hypothetical protein